MPPENPARKPILKSGEYVRTFSNGLGMEEDCIRKGQAFSPIFSQTRRWPSGHWPWLG
jgi:hypothetical protein